jgi:hypothetical protein
MTILAIATGIWIVLWLFWKLSIMLKPQQPQLRKPYNEKPSKGSE